ncbi:MAG: SusD/RagB family nutrient-binding outer membrane lipoprotein [Draconibacterium sp.]
MKNRILLLIIGFAACIVALNSCSDSELERLYPDPSKSSTATIENFFTGILQSSNEVVMPWYWRFFVTEQPTMGHYTQVMGWLNAKDQYIPSAQAMEWRWDQFYNGPMTQFRELERLYNAADETEQQNKKIFMLAAKIFFYDQSAQIVDLYDDIPWSEAGKLRETGSLTASVPVYDGGQSVYTAILDDLKSIADELSNIQVEAFYAGLFTEKDYLNNGNIMLWRKYCNSLRLRLLLRVSDILGDRAASEIASILNNPSQYPVVTGNDDDIMLDAEGPDLYSTTKSQTGGIQQAMLTWGQYDIAPKAMVDHMRNNNDPRLVITFDENKNGEYIGMDPLNNATVQDKNLTDSLVSRYDASTYVRNDYFPGFVITAAEVSFLKAEAYLKEYAPGDAQAAYETGIKQSIEMYYEINAAGDYREPIEAPGESAVAGYIASENISWSDNSDKISLLADQKWLNSGLGQMSLTWAETRRLNKPDFTFLVDGTSDQTAPPVRWLYPQSEKQLNGANYDAVKSKDELNTKVFWDIN